MTLRPCLGYHGHTCPRLVPGNRCPQHQRLYEQGRRPQPSARDRGYNTAHDRERAQWKPKVDAGLVNCRRCEQPIEPGRPWDLGHPDADCPKPKAPEHARCNRSAAGRSAHRDAGSDGHAYA